MASGRSDDTEMGVGVGVCVCVKRGNVYYQKIWPRRSSESEAALCSGSWEWVGGWSPLRAACGWHPASEEGVTPDKGREGEQGGRGSGAGTEGHAGQAPWAFRAPASYSLPTCPASHPGKASSSHR